MAQQAALNLAQQKLATQQQAAFSMAQQQMAAQHKAAIARAHQQIAAMHHVAATRASSAATFTTSACHAAQMTTHASAMRETAKSVDVKDCNQVQVQPEKQTADPGLTEESMKQLPSATGKDSGSVSGRHGVMQSVRESSPLKKPTGANLPSDVLVSQFAQKRAREIETLTVELMMADTPFGKPVFQTIPRHMRRRTMSYNVKRLPRRLQASQTGQFSKVAPVGPGKRPSRKHRRRPSNLLEEYTRRQRRNVWLETHIWHAKRFKMADLWGYKIPLHPCDKSIRASYRASARHCLLQDVSYLCCLELRGSEQEIITGMRDVTSTDTGLSVAAKAYISGTRQGSTVLYGPSQYPHNALGQADFIWEPVFGTTSSERRRLWIWVHASCSKAVLTALLTAFHMSDSPTFTDSPSSQESDPKAAADVSADSHGEKPRDQEAMPSHSEDQCSPGIAGSTAADQGREPSKAEVVNSLATDAKARKNVAKKKRPAKRKKAGEAAAATTTKRKPFEVAPAVAATYTNGRVTLVSLKDKLVRFRLTGPLSQAVLCDLLQPADVVVAAAAPSGGNVAAAAVAAESEAEMAPSTVGDGNSSSIPKCEEGKDGEEDGGGTVSPGTPPDGSTEQQYSSIEQCQSDSPALCKLVRSVATLAAKVLLPVGSSEHCEEESTVATPVVSGPEDKAALEEIDRPAVVDAATIPKWWEVYYTHQQKAEQQRSQAEAWRALKAVQSPAELPPHCVLGLTVRDPRIFLPKKRTKVMNEVTEVAVQQVDVATRLPEGISASPLWDEGIRKEVTTTKLTEQEMNRLRSQNIVPGTPLQLGREESRVPILLVQNPGHGDARQPTTLGYGSGWDVVLPCGWSMAFWVGLVYRGARAAGLRECTACCWERGVPSFPDGYPDTEAARIHQTKVREKLEMEYFRRPPDKRPKLYQVWIVSHVQLPLKHPRGRVGKERFYVLRSQRDLQTLSQLDKRLKTSPTLDNESQQRSIDKMDAVLQHHVSAIVAVRLKMLQRGTPNRFATICLPSPDDLERLLKDKQYGGPLEQRHKDVSTPKLKALLAEHKKIARKKAKMAAASTGEAAKRCGGGAADGGARVAASRREMFGDVAGVVGHCCRDAMGFVIAGNFSFTVGGGCAVGFCSVAGLVEAARAQQRSPPLVVLVRNPASLQYRFAKLDILR
ncbi:PREDICTED: ribonucleases P/MRP protein subunit POP1-like [Priapulus caudatus]|uniref:Ribonucleases P/MRP protein subunit POP1-like n=1 Tax=Priapulus caudatus TaxID=37621 RepID=A0ABM1DWP7_PRICU|nr:PREDICTED: ribonucleases P/MRP protein subunit POP1-like [Priapulus caudatus]